LGKLLPKIIPCFIISENERHKFENALLLIWAFNMFCLW